MNEGSYNNVVRSNSSFSPMTPSTPSAYKANVNRTKTRKWVEAKVQNYDGDDWGNEYEDEYGEPEPEPEPEPVSRVAALRQQVNSQQSRTFPQPSAGVSNSSSRPGPFGARNPSGPPSLHIQTGSNSGSHPIDTSAPPSDRGSLSSRLAFRDTGGNREGTPVSDITAPGSGSQPGSISGTQLWTQRAASPTKSSNLVGSSDLYTRIDENKKQDSRVMEPGGLMVESAYGQNSGFVSERERINQRRLSASPKLPDLARMSGFGDDLFSNPGNYSSRAHSSLSTITDGQQTDGVGDKNASSALVGPKLEPNPPIIMPPLEAGSESTRNDSVNASRQSAVSRPQLPGTWVSETISVGSENSMPAERVEGSGLASGGIANANVPPMNMRHAEPADLEPTTAVRQLPSKYSDLDATLENKATQMSEGGFDCVAGKHDDAVASKVIAAGPGYHPTPQSLPPLKTDPHPASPNTSSDGRESSKVTDMGLPASHRDSPPQPSSAQQSATASSSFTPTAPLNPRRSIIAPTELATPTGQERKSTISTVDTASPEKESDKLREEIMKSLSANRGNAPDAGAILGSSNAAFDATQDGPSRESTYLSGVYDDYLSPVEDKSLQETGLLLKQGSKPVDYGSYETEPEPEPEPEQDVRKGNSFPDIAPLSPRRSPEQGIRRPQKRFSWENKLDGGNVSSTGVIPSIPIDPSDSTKSNQVGLESSPPTGLGSNATSPNALQVKTESRTTISHQVSDVSSRAPGDPSLAGLDSPSPVSLVMENGPRTQSSALENSRLSFADEKEKVLIQSSSNTSSADQHPALASPMEPTPEPIPSFQTTSATQPSSQPKIMAFRDILNIASIEQRIQKFDDTRAQFYSMDSGLSNWIMYVQSQPEHGAASTASVEGRTSPGFQSPSQQPYSQQHLNSGGTDAPVQRGRAASNNLQHMFTGQGMSNLGSSGAQVGTKSKELLQAAGAFGNKGMKSGMKLFNKGKNKLRGTGEKGFFQ
ncbi:hypothetical protein F5Y11DRAFT_273112 [Daldinia sp. FL1419]|nr:hypothetical protein F5Y11DRAFT_273112 [Daldinia sp. FL1419]